MKTLSELTTMFSVKTMKKTQEITEEHSDFIYNGKYKKTTQIKCAHEGIFWLVMQKYQGREDIDANLSDLLINVSEYVDWRLHPSYQENEKILNQSVQEWEEFLATEEGKAWAGEEE